MASFQWTTWLYNFFMNSMKSGLGFDHKSCVVTGSIVEGSFEFFWKWGSVSERVEFGER